MQRQKIRTPRAHISFACPLWVLPWSPMRDEAITYVRNRETQASSPLRSAECGTLVLHNSSFHPPNEITSSLGNQAYTRKRKQLKHSLRFRVPWVNCGILCVSFVVRTKDCVASWFESMTPNMV